VISDDEDDKMRDLFPILATPSIAGCMARREPLPVRGLQREPSPVFDPA
jgi:hypothetical protein